MTWAISRPMGPAPRNPHALGKVVRFEQRVVIEVSGFGKARNGWCEGHGAGGDHKPLGAQRSKTFHLHFPIRHEAGGSEVHVHAHVTKALRVIVVLDNPPNRNACEPSHQRMRASGPQP